MSADFWAGYVSGAAGIIIGNPLDIVKVNLQRGVSSIPSPPSPSLASSTTTTTTTTNASTLLKGTAAPILGYGALNALMFMTYNRCMTLLSQDPSHPTSLSKTWLAGALGGLATFVVSAPTELIKCRAQVTSSTGDGASSSSSWKIARELWKDRGVRGLYWGGAVTSARDSIGYGFYFWSYELSKRVLISQTSTPGQGIHDKNKNNDTKPEWMTILLCGGIAGVITWASVFPLDVIKTRVQTQDIITTIATTTTNTQRPAAIVSSLAEQTRLLDAAAAASSSSSSSSTESRRLGAIQIAKQAYRQQGLSVFFRGLGVCSVRAFFVNAVQWAVYEWMMHVLLKTTSPR